MKMYAKLLWHEHENHWPQSDLIPCIFLRIVYLFIFIYFSGVVQFLCWEHFQSEEKKDALFAKMKY